MFVMEFLRNRTPNLAIAALTTLVLALMMLSWSARPAHACLMSTPPPGTNSFAAAPQLRVGYDSTVYNSDGTATTTSCSFPNGIDTKGTTSGATMEVGEPRPYSSTKDCGIYGVSSSVWWKVTVGRYDLPSRLYGSTGNAYLRLRTGGSSFDTVLAVYQGTSLTSLRQIACSNNNALPNWTDTLYTPITPGQTYYVQLTGTGGARSGSYVLNSTWVSPSEYARVTKL